MANEEIGAIHEREMGMAEKALSGKDVFNRCCKSLCVFCNELGEPTEKNAVLTANGEPFWHKDGALWRKCQCSELRKNTRWILGDMLLHSDTPQTVNFICGCFISWWADAGFLRYALACCVNHEAPNQSVANLSQKYDIAFLLKDGFVEKEVCCVCSVPIMRTFHRDRILQWSPWIHNDPQKSNYHKEACIERGRSAHSSTIPTAQPEDMSDGQ